MGYLCGKRQALGPKKWNHACDIAFEVLSDHDAEHLEPREILEALWQRWFDLQANPSETIEAVGLPFDSYLQSETVKELPKSSGIVTAAEYAGIVTGLVERIQRGERINLTEALKSVRIKEESWNSSRCSSSIMDLAKKKKS